MKKLIIFLLCVIFLSACGSCPKKVKKPAGIILDKNSYNDVYTVYWHYFENIPDTIIDNDTILMCGYIVHNLGTDKPYYPITLIDDSLKAITPVNPDGIREVQIFCNDSIFSQIDSIINVSMPHKCFVTGVVNLSSIENNCYIYSVPKLKIKNINDIYFEEE